MMDKAAVVARQAEEFFKLFRRVDRASDPILKTIGMASLSVAADGLARAIAEMRKSS